MTTFDRPSLLDQRYGDIAETSAFTYDDDDLVNYADFLRKHGRYMTKNGFVDSSRRIRSLHRQQDEVFTSQNRPAQSKTGLLATLNKASFAGSLPAISVNDQKSKPSTTAALTSVLSVTTNLDEKERDHDKQMRLIEEQVIKAKQSERESKRFDGDYRKEQRHLQQTLKELDTETNKKMAEVEKSLSKNADDKERIERELIKKRDQQTKQRAEQYIDMLQTSKDRDRRSVLVCNDLARQYRIKANQLEMAQQQIGRLHSEFEQKVQLKEIEENQIKRDIGDLAIALSTEAQKAKKEEHKFVVALTRDQTKTVKSDLQQEKSFEQRLNETSIHVKNYDLERRRLSADVGVSRSMLDLKQREALRKIVDTKNRLETIYAEQRQLNESAAVAEQDRRGAELMAKMADVESRRGQLMDQYLREKIERSEERETQGAVKAKIRYAEHETREHEDHLRHFQKSVVKNNEVEQDLKKIVRDSEAERRKKEQEVQRLQEELNRKKRDYAAKIREQIAQAEREERELEELMLKEKSKLDQLHTKREDNYAQLIKQREQIRETKNLLETHAREHERLIRVHARTQSIQSINTI